MNFHNIHHCRFQEILNPKHRSRTSKMSFSLIRHKIFTYFFFSISFAHTRLRRAEGIMFHKYHTFFHKVIVWRSVSQCSESYIDFSTRGPCLKEHFSMFHEFHTFLHGLLENGIAMFQPKCYWLRFWYSSKRRWKDSAAATLTHSVCFRGSYYRRDPSNRHLLWTLQAANQEAASNCL